MGKLLTSNKKHVEILTSIRVDKSLPKYRVMNEVSGGDTDKMLTNNTFFTTPFGTNNNSVKTNEALTYENLKKFLSEKSENVTDFNINVTATLNSILDRTTMSGVTFNMSAVDGVNKRKRNTMVNYCFLFQKE